ncbi:hypothetical protein [Brevundimonas sp. NIBR11]|uniref:hypothetical protein n=1 Tax=Brevundimonas sp. NIBR11 TaxID=3015999 RepID=UPI0022F12E4B|nr:hypothetical protein [Brevundimonas sp. NIBR11]WGM31674.1 hypothetical protein KKHFBJBL_01921 [Brevundimonas sp. NIBR11]
MSKETVGEALSARLHSAEAAIDLALSEVAHLAAMLPAARSQAYLSAVTGQKAFDGAAAAIGALTQARSNMVDTHNTLAALARKMGLDTVAVGPLDKPEDPVPIGGGVSQSLTPMVKEVLPTSL